jgi:hypothetical protein
MVIVVPRPGAHIGWGHNKWICGSEWAGHRSRTYIHTYYMTRPGHGVPGSTQLQILDLPVLEPNTLNFNFF